MTVLMFSHNKCIGACRHYFNGHKLKQTGFPYGTPGLQPSQIEVSVFLIEMSVLEMEIAVFLIQKSELEMQISLQFTINTYTCMSLFLIQIAYLY